MTSIKEKGNMQSGALVFAASRILNDTFPRRVYKPSSSGTVDDVVTKGLHFGQRKLLLSEIEFLTECVAVSEGRGGGGGREAEAAIYSKPFLVVYSGAANGSHLPFLFRMFSSVKFVLIDPAPFCAAVHEIAKQPDGPILELIEDYCTDELCLRLSRAYRLKYNMLLISDIRSGEPKKQCNRENTSMIMQDNELQRGWCWSLRAEAALLKFHPPYPRCTDPNALSYDAADDTPSSVEYFDGTRLFGVWAPKSSSEVRLCVVGPFTPGAKIPMRRYDCTVHEEQCYFYNTDGRYTRDCEAERCILSRYAEAFPGSCPDGVVALSNTISEFLGFPLFQPLVASFTENNARWVTLLYSTRDPDALKLYEPLREQITLDAIRPLITKWKDAVDVPSCSEIGPAELSQDFWKVMCVGNLSEVYGIPRIRWRFAPKLITRKTSRNAR